MPDENSTLTFHGSNFFRQRLILSVITGKSVVVSDIRTQDNEPGLREYEVNLLRLLDKLTNGTWLEVNETGTRFIFTPGALIGGKVDHECCKMRGIGYYLEVILALAPFFKKPLNITFYGVTNNDIDVSVDSFKTAGLNTLRQFLVIDPGLEMTIRKRGMPPEGGGEVNFICPNLKLKPVQRKEMGKVKRIRGTVYALRVSPAFANRFIDTAKGELIKFIPDVFLTSDHRKGLASGKSPGYGGTLVAYTTEDVQLTSEAVSKGPHTLPEDLGKSAAWRLLDEISRGGIIDSSFQILAITYMSFTQKDVSQIVIGPLSPYAIEYLRHVREFVGLMFQLDPFVENSMNEKLNLGTSKVLLTCVGVGYNKLL